MRLIVQAMLTISDWSAKALLVSSLLGIAVNPDAALAQAGSGTSYVIQGQVRQQDGRTFVGGIVRAADRTARGETPLGQAVTDRQGRYRIRYTAAQLGGRTRADLIVRVFNSPAPSSAALATSSVTNAPPTAVVNLTISARPAN